MMQIDNKFEIGQVVYVIRKVKVENPCPACNGEGHKIIGGHKFYCSKCGGVGFLKSKKKEYQVIGVMEITLIKTITRIEGENSEPCTIIRYNVGNLKEVPEHYLFVDGEEAIKYCAELNKRMED